MVVSEPVERLRLSFLNQTNDVVVGSNLTIGTVPKPSSLARVAKPSAVKAAWITARQRVGSSVAS